jgi:putative addiction module component (TIGR02574 family)
MTTEALTSAALALPPESRAALAELLLSSLDSAGGTKYQEEWEHEIEQRLAAYDRGEMQSFSREEVMRELEDEQAA